MYKYLSWAAVVMWMSVIFYLSHQPAASSNELSGGVVEVIVTTIGTVTSSSVNTENFNFIVRKSAHFLAYFLLGVLVLNALRSNGLQVYRRMGLAFLICVGYAVSDEVHQIFIPGRSGEIRDVLIDSAGAGVGIGVMWLLGRIFRKKSS
ncbi:VanZ family protein [Anaerobacillus sp. MEB173]|uniref:VanZ family protein n=1 Tax=Anaerobacillus sp. MEB173 TaxID=3383345 RepID=UPI003F9185F2